MSVVSSDRMSFIIYYRGKRIFKALEKLDVNIAYQSPRMRYIILYANKEDEEMLRNELRKVRGFQRISRSKIFKEELNF